MKLVVLLLLQLAFAIIAVNGQRGYYGGGGGYGGGHGGGGGYGGVQKIDRNLCRPFYTTKEGVCLDRRRRCILDHNIELKWTGRGSRSPEGRALGDGGCQCKDYCGYFSQRPCNADRGCLWSTTRGLCLHKNTYRPGRPIVKCPVSRRPPHGGGGSGNGGDKGDRGDNGDGDGEWERPDEDDDKKGDDGEDDNDDDPNGPPPFSEF